MKSSTETALEALLDWWGMAGVVSAEAELIMAAPKPVAAKAEAPALDDRPRPAPRAPKPAAKNPSQDARAAAAAAPDLPALAAAIAAFDGCGLKKTARNPVVFDGAFDAPVLVVGEAPGREEDAAGKPFVGRSGQLLDRMLGSIGLSRETNVLITNVIFWRPPGNRPPTQVEIASCVPFVERAIALARPKILLLAGGFAAQTVLKREDGVMRLRHKRLSCTVEGLTDPLHAMVILHPAYLLRRPQDKRLAWQDLLAMAQWADELGVARGKGD